MFHTFSMFTKTSASNTLLTKLKWQKTSRYQYGEASFFDFDKDGKLDVIFMTEEGMEIYDHDLLFAKFVELSLSRKKQYEIIVSFLRT